MRTWLALLSFAFLTQIAPAQFPAAASIRGVLLRWGTEEPVGQATIELRALSGASAPVAITASQDSGGFVFSNIPAGTYRIVAMADGFSPAEFGQLRPGGGGRPFTVGPGEHPDIKMGIVPGGIISGKVTDSNGQPMVYSNIDIMKVTYNITGQAAPVIALSVTANDLGEYRAFWLSPGQYIVRAGNSRLNYFTSQGTVNPMNSDTSIPSTLSFSNDKAKARTAPANDTPESNVVPILSNYFGGAIDAANAQVIDVRAGAEVAGVDVRVAPALFTRRVRINGVVVDPAGQPLQGNFGTSISTWPEGQATVFASTEFITIRVPSTNPSDVSRGAMRYVMDNGKFEGSASSGAYQIRASQGDLSGRAVIQVGNQDLNVTIPLRPPTTITGLVRIEAGSANASFDLSKMQVAVRTPPSNIFSSALLPDGQFRIERVIPGDYQVYVPPLIPTPESIGGVRAVPAGMENAYVKSIHAGISDVTDGVIRIEGNEPIGAMEIVIGLDGVSINGHVVNALQEPADRATVVLLPQGQTAIHTDRYRTLVTDKSGQFEFRGLPPGDYRLLAWEDVDPGAWFNPAFLAAYEHNALAVQLVAGQHQTMEIPAIPVTP